MCTFDPNALSVQMEADGNAADNVAGNVVLQEAVEPEVELIGPQLGNLRKYCEGDTVSLPSDMDRWIPLETFTWQESHPKDTLIKSGCLPYGAVWTTDAKDPTKVAMRENVLVNMCRVRQFVHSDIEVRVELNSIPFAIGQLQLGFLYASKEDKYASLRTNAAGISQMNHVLIDASQANAGSLVIPYRSYRPYMPINARRDMGYQLALGHYYLNVLTPLNVSSGISSVDGVIMVRFTNCTMTGMVPPGLSNTETQMFTMMNAAAAANWLFQRYADTNRDMPPSPHAPSPIYPDAVGTLAHGTNYVEPVHSMRLDAKGQTPHPDGVPDEMSVSFVASKFGYMESISLPATSASGTAVFCYDAAPVQKLTHYATTTRDGVKCYTLPPVAVISQLFAYWRGSIQFRFDFVATRFHQTRLFFAWIPGYLGTQLTLAQAESCAGTYFDLKEDNRSCTITVPFIADRPWWSHRYANGVDAEEIEAPGQFCCYVVNRLTYTNTVSNKITINVYCRGGTDFEVAVPMQPTIGLAYNAQFKNQSDTFVQAVPGYYPYYPGTWREVEGGASYMLRYGDVTDHVVQFYGLQPHTYYRFEDKALAKTMTLTTGSSSVQNVLTGDNMMLVPVNVDDGYGTVYMGIFDPDKTANIVDYFYVKKGNKWTLREPKAYNYDMLLKGTYVTSTYYSPASTNPKLVPTDVPMPSNSDTDEEYDMVTQGDTREACGSNIVFETMTLQQASQETFGEDFSSLKTLCRRYQPYLQVPLAATFTSFGAVNFTWPIIPGGLDLVPTTSDFANACREGIIPIILSGYRFFRGGIRFKMVPNYPDYVIYAVQVKPDRALLSCNPRAGGKTRADTMMQHGYATSAQSCHVNPVMTVEIPFYMPGSCGLLCRPSDEALTMSGVNRFFSLGELCVSATTAPAVAERVTNSNLVVMYALADDFSAHTFQGFPPVVFIKESKLG